MAALTDSTGAVVERYKYDAYGRQGITNLNGTVSYCPSDYGNFVGFTGRYHDWETGLVYFRARYYDTGLGRFIGRDPLGYVNGKGLYAAYYVPNGLDPFGLFDLITYGTWTPQDVKDVLNSVDRVSSRIAQMIGDMNNKINSLKGDSSCYAPLSDGLTKARDILQKELNGFLYSNTPILLSQETGADRGGAWKPASWWTKAQVILPSNLFEGINGATDASGLAAAEEQLDESVLHEFSHEVGSDDGTTTDNQGSANPAGLNDFTNAHYLQNFMNDPNIDKWPPYANAKRNIDKSPHGCCGK